MRRGRWRTGRGGRAVENEDIASALVRFAGGVTGVLSSSRSAWGRKNRLGFEVHGTRGMIVFEQERMNELQLFVNEGPAAEQGFRTILTGPAHPPYARLHAGAGAPARVQRPEGDRGGGVPAGDRGRASGRIRTSPTALAFERVIHAIDRSGREGVRVAVG